MSQLNPKLSQLNPKLSPEKGIFEPVRDTFFVQKTPFDPPTMQFMITGRKMPPDAEVAVLLGLHQTLGGPYKLIYVFRRLRCLHIYEILSHGREWWFSLHYTTDSRFSLLELAQETKDRRYTTSSPPHLFISSLYLSKVSTARMVLALGWRGVSNRRPW